MFTQRSSSLNILQPRFFAPILMKGEIRRITYPHRESVLLKHSLPFHDATSRHSWLSSPHLKPCSFRRRSSKRSRQQQRRQIVLANETPPVTWCLSNIVGCCVTNLFAAKKLNQVALLPSPFHRSHGNSRDGGGVQCGQEL